jgi:hypothetical protein
MSRWFDLACAVGCAASAFACSGSDKSPPKAPDPTVSITEPVDKSTITITDDPDVQVGFAVTNFDLEDLGMCAGAPHCGHVHVNIDGHECDDHEDGDIRSFTAESATSPVGSGLDYCTDAVMGVPAQRTYTIVVGLYDDDEAAVNDSSGKAVTNSVDIDVKIAPSDGTPDAGP